MGRNFGFSFSWRRAIGISGMKNRISRAIGIPLTRSGRERKIGRIICNVFSPAVAALTIKRQQSTKRQLDRLTVDNHSSMGDNEEYQDCEGCFPIIIIAMIFMLLLAFIISIVIHDNGKNNQPQTNQEPQVFHSYSKDPCIKNLNSNNNTTQIDVPKVITIPKCPKCNSNLWEIKEDGIAKNYCPKCTPNNKEPLISKIEPSLEEISFPDSNRLDVVFDEPKIKPPVIIKQIPCRTCKGTGEIKIKIVTPNSGFMSVPTISYSTKTCPRCNGTKLEGKKQNDL